MLGFEITFIEVTKILKAHSIRQMLFFNMVQQTQLQKYLCTSQHSLHNYLWLSEVISPGSQIK